MADGISDFNETEDFEEYNPHPYQGGYDIALTYGDPLPPLSAICYPLSDSSSHPTLPPNGPLPLIPMEYPASSDASERAISISDEREDDRADPAYDSSYGNGERGFTSAEWWWNHSGFSPFAMNGFGGCSYDAEEMRYWSPLRRAAEYIFGYSQGFGERTIGVDSYGIPIYAYKLRGSDTVNVEIQPARTEQLEYHDNSKRWSSTYNNWEDENHRLCRSAHAYPQHHSEESFEAEVDSFPLSYGESMNEVNLNGNLEMAYNKRYYSGALNVQLEPVESSFQQLSYHEEFSHTNSNSEPLFGIHGEERNEFTNVYHDYQRQVYHQPSNFELEPYKPTWARYSGNYRISEEDISDYYEVDRESYSPSSAWPTSFDETGDEGKFHSSEYAYKAHHDGHFLALEPFKPTWMLNPNYYGSYEEFSAPDKQLYSSDVSSKFHKMMMDPMVAFAENGGQFAFLADLFLL
ncbi:uncharacterized protein At5g39570-like isoform X2 [Phalaenopsis equestris]|uniref:uncharacterized protein At5g39570-like isoform X2 n=1 Tax=Phalaenopsis equestris TaxID=78828 RepID=UPI0009E33948|nr:uncharacterized protein At5g39570-like isoform X2 [Phalaenopsis equestris]